MLQTSADLIDDAVAMGALLGASRGVCCERRAGQTASARCHRIQARGPSERPHFKRGVCPQPGVLSYPEKSRQATLGHLICNTSRAPGTTRLLDPRVPRAAWAAAAPEHDHWDAPQPPPRHSSPRYQYRGRGTSPSLLHTPRQAAACRSARSAPDPRTRWQRAARGGGGVAAGALRAAPCRLWAGTRGRAPSRRRRPGLSRRGSPRRGRTMPTCTPTATFYQGLHIITSHLLYRWGHKRTRPHQSLNNHPLAALSWQPSARHGRDTGRVSRPRERLS